MICAVWAGHAGIPTAESAPAEERADGCSEVLSIWQHQQIGRQQQQQPPSEGRTLTSYAARVVVFILVVFGSSITIIILLNIPRHTYIHDPRALCGGRLEHAAMFFLYKFHNP